MGGESPSSIEGISDCTAISGRSHHRTDTCCLADGSCTTARTTDIQRIAIRHDSTIIDEGVHIGIGSELPRYPLPHFNSHFIVAAGTDGALIRPAVFRGLQYKCSRSLMVVPLIVTVEPFEKVAGECSVISVAENE